MQVLLNIKIFLDKFITIPKFTITDAVEILIIAFMIYEVLVWIKSTRAWMLLKGILILLVFVIVATIFNLSTILWISN